MEFEREKGYIGYDLFFPKLERGKVAYELETVKVSKLLPFNESKHIIKAEAKEVKNFPGDPEGEIPLDPNGPDLSKAPDFEL